MSHYHLLISFSDRGIEAGYCKMWDVILAISSLILLLVLISLNPLLEALLLPCVIFGLLFPFAYAVFFGQLVKTRNVF